MTVSQDKKHINNVIANDNRVAHDIKQLNTQTAVKLQNFLLAFSARNSDNGELPSYILQQKLDSADAKAIANIFHDYRPNGDDYADTTIKMAGADYKRNKLTFIQSSIMALLAINGQKVLSVMQSEGKQDLNSEVSYMFGQNGYLKTNTTVKQAQKIVPNQDTYADDQGQTIASTVNKHSTFTANLISNLIIARIRTSPQTSDFNDFVQSGTIHLPKVTKQDMQTPPKQRKTAVSNDLQGLFDQLSSNYSTDYRTWSADMHSALKASVASQLGLENATIINEFGACDECLPYIGKTMSVDDACDLLPIHPNCRCEVRLLNDNETLDDIDDE